MLFIFGGLPGTGKSTLASRLAREFGAAYLRLDSIEEGLEPPAGRASYEIAQRLAADNLKLGIQVVADCVNPVKESREDWRRVAEAAGTPCLTIEIICSDIEKHRQRVERRLAERPGPTVPTWAQVRERCYDEWDEVDLVFDTAELQFGEMADEFLERVRALLQDRTCA